MKRFAILGIALALGLSIAARSDDAPDDKARVEAEARGQAAAADRLLKAGRYAEALPLYEAERASRAALGDRRYEAYALRAIGCCHSGLSDDDNAIAAWLDARVLDAKREDPGFEGYDWLLIGQAHFRRGRLDPAITALTRSLPLLTQAIDRDHEIDARVALIDALLQRSAPRLAEPHVDAAEELARRLDDPKRAAAVWFAGARVALAAGAPGLAAERADDARRGFSALDMKPEAAAATGTLGLALADLDRLEAAADALADSARIHETLHDDPALADDLHLLAAVQADAGALAEAIAVARRALKVRQRVDDPSGTIDAIVDLAHYQGEAGDWPGSSSTLAVALPLARREAPPPRLVHLLVLAADVSRAAGDSGRARTLLDEAERAALRADNGALRRIVADARAAANAGP